MNCQMPLYRFKRIALSIFLLALLIEEAEDIVSPATNRCSYRGCLITPAAAEGCFPGDNGDCILPAGDHQQQQTEFLNVIANSACKWNFAVRSSFSSYFNAMHNIIYGGAWPTQTAKLDALLTPMSAYAANDPVRQQQFRSIPFETWSGTVGDFIVCGQKPELQTPDCCCPLDFTRTTSTVQTCGASTPASSTSPISAKCATPWQELVPIRFSPSADSPSLHLTVEQAGCHCTSTLEDVYYAPGQSPAPGPFAVEVQCVAGMSAFCMCTETGECFTVDAGIRSVQFQPFCDPTACTCSSCHMYAVLESVDGHSGQATGDQGTALRFQDQLDSAGNLKPLGSSSAYARAESTSCQGCAGIKGVVCTSPSYCAYPVGCQPYDCTCRVNLGG